MQRFALLRILTAVILSYGFLFLPSHAVQPPKTKRKSTPQWAAVVVCATGDLFEPRSEEEDPATGTIRAITDASKTLIITHDRKALIAACVASFQGSLCRLRSKTIKTKVGSAQVLQRQKLGENQWRTVLGQEYVRDARTGIWDDYDSTIGLLTVYGNLFGVGAQASRHQGGAGNENFFEVFQYRERNGRLVRVSLSEIPQGIRDASDKFFQSLGDEYKDQFNPDASGFFILPTRGGASVSFCHGGFSVMTRGFACMTAPSQTFDIRASNIIPSKNFISANHGLIPETAQFSTVAPDGSATVFSNGGRLCWRSNKGVSRDAGLVDKVRGIQWVDLKALPATDLKVLSPMLKPF